MRAEADAKQLKEKQGVAMGLKPGTRKQRRQKTLPEELQPDDERRLLEEERAAKRMAKQDNTYGQSGSAVDGEAEACRPSIKLAIEEVFTSDIIVAQEPSNRSLTVYRSLSSNSNHAYSQGRERNKDAPLRLLLTAMAARSGLTDKPWLIPPYTY
jgi:hypothetical protein